MVVQGIELASSLDGIKLPLDCEIQLVDGRLPEVKLGEVAFLVSTSGQLYRRVVNNGKHAAIALPEVHTIKAKKKSR